MTDTYNPEQNGKDSYALAIKTIREQLEKPADDVLNAVCEVTQVGLRSLKADMRSQHIVYPRFLAYLLLSELLGWSGLKIGRKLEKDASSVHHGVSRAIALLDEDETFKGWRESVLEKLAGRQAA